MVEDLRVLSCLARRQYKYFRASLPCDSSVDTEVSAIYGICDKIAEAQRVECGRKMTNLTHMIQFGGHAAVSVREMRR